MLIRLIPLIVIFLVGCGSGTQIDTQLQSSSTKYKSDETISPCRESNISIFNEFNVGFGGSGSVAFISNGSDRIWVSSVDLLMDSNIAQNSYYQNIRNFNGDKFSLLQSKLKNSKFLVYWLTENWSEEWFSVAKIQQAMNAGYIPVFNYWYFGDKLNSIPTNLDDYRENNLKVVEFLNKLNGTKILILEPEFNKNSIVSSDTNQKEFANIIGDAIDIIKSNTTDVLFSLSMMDTGNRGMDETYEKCGYDNCALGDKYEWGKPDIIYTQLLEKLDFISFSQMVAQFSRDPQNSGDWNNPNPIKYSDRDIGIDMLPSRINNLTQFLHNKYNKPIFMPYITIATATWSDTNLNNKIEESEIDKDGWIEKANQTYQNLSQIKSQLQSNGLFGFAPMALFDDPRHDYGGYQFFMNNEYHLGIIGSSSIDEQDNGVDGDIYFKGDILGYIFSD